RDSLVDFVFSSRRRHTRSKRDWSSDVCSSERARVIADRANRQAKARYNPIHRRCRRWKSKKITVGRLAKLRLYLSSRVLTSFHCVDCSQSDWLVTFSKFLTCEVVNNGMVVEFQKLIPSDWRIFIRRS